MEKTPRLRQPCGRSGASESQKASCSIFFLSLTSIWLSSAWTFLCNSPILSCKRLILFLAAAPEPSRHFLNKLPLELLPLLRSHTHLAPGEFPSHLPLVLQALLRFQWSRLWQQSPRTRPQTGFLENSTSSMSSRRFPRLRCCRRKRCRARQRRNERSVCRFAPRDAAQRRPF